MIQARNSTSLVRKLSQFWDIPSDRFGSEAACQHHIKRTAASGTNPAIQQTNFQNPNLNVCFAQYRTFRSSNYQRNDWPLSVRSGHSGGQNSG